MTVKTFNERLTRNLLQLEQRGQRRLARTVNSLPDGRCLLNGKQLVNFGGNDYLNLAHEVSGKDSVLTVFQQQTGSTASALVCGRSEWHHSLEKALAAFENTEAALLFPTGYAANLGVLGSLVESKDAIFCDRDNHASLIDAAKSCDGQFYVYRRDRLDKLSDSIGRRRSQYDQVFIVTDGVYSMDGTIASMNELCQVAERFDCQMIVDEAHGTGVLGNSGRGTCDVCEVEDRVAVRIGTMSKAMGGLGGFVVGTNSIIEWLRNTARTQFFSTALPPGICAAMLESLQLIQSEPERRSKLAQLTEYAHRRLRELSLESVGYGVAPIIPVLIKDDAKVVAVSQQLEAAGFFIPAIRPPTVPAGTARLRFSLTVKHSIQQVDSALSEVAGVLNSGAQCSSR